MNYTVRPISDRTAFTGKHESSPFTATWSDTLVLLDREITALAGKRLVIEVDVPERGIRLDGQLRADARASSPAVRIAFESKHGPLVYATDRYVRPSWARSRMDDWQHNVRAIALGLEALRKVDRYGISRRGEQYRGYKAIGAGGGLAPSGMTTELALEIIDREAGWIVGGTTRWLAHHGPRAALRQARAVAHPDRNHGDRSRWDAVEQAAQVLERAGMLR